MGFQEPAPRSKSISRGSSPAWWVALAAVAVAVWLWVDRSSNTQVETPAESQEARQPSRTVLDSSQAEQIIHLQKMLREAQRELADRQEEIENLKAELQRAQTDAELHRRGLERAVEEIDRINAHLDELDKLASAVPSPSLPPPPSNKVRPLGAPFVTTSLNGYVVASGMVHNPTRASARGTLEVSLVGSGGVIDTRGFVMHIGPGETERYDVTFTNIFPTERLGAQARWVE